MFRGLAKQPQSLVPKRMVDKSSCITYVPTSRWSQQQIYSLQPGEGQIIGQVEAMAMAHLTGILIFSE